jgi:di/tricarboxylate transporter
MILDDYEENPSSFQKGKILILIFLAALTVGSFEWLPFSVCFLICAVFTILLKGIPIERAYHLIDWRLLILIGGMSAFGTAMAKTGTDKFISGLIVDGLQPYGVEAIFGGFLILTVLLTQPMSNAAAALVVMPIALQTALDLDVNPRTFAMGVMLSASVSLITPFEPSCILVYGPGKYKFSDFLKIGGALTFLILIVLFFLVPYYWPFKI